MALSRRGGSRSSNHSGGRGGHRGSRGRGGGSDSNDPPPNRVPLPESFQSWAHHNQHPGLALDKFARSVSSSGEPLSKISEKIQRPTIEEVVRLTRAFSPKLYQRLLARQTRLWETVQAVTFVGRTDGPVTLHLARASSLENAGIALHRIYGLPYLPATGLKGLARAYAETVWFPAQFQTDQDGSPVDEQAKEAAECAWRRIETVFGWSPGSDRDKSYKPRTLANPASDASAGAVVFHDAWCTDVPKLEVDILNNHHRSYYDGESQPTGPPGDWDDPVPVYFLTLASHQTFRFALSLRHPDADSAKLAEALALAHQWLIGGLAMLGAGAKTNAGYGAFTFSSDSVPEDVLQQALAPWKTAEQLGRRKTRRVEVELVTPAFLAGAEPFGENARFGCDMRPATVRGLMRWWWRTLHAGFLSVKQLRELESAIFGDTKAAGALQLRVTAAHAPTGQAQLFDFKDWSPGKDGRPPRRATKPRPDFRKQFQLLPTPNPQTTQGLFYAAYGMDDAPGNDATKRRYFRHPGQRWTIELIARPARLPNSEDRLTADDVLQHAQAALWLWTHYGGIGSKSRKGFGSLQWHSPDPPFSSLDACRQWAKQWRSRHELPDRFQADLAKSPALGDGQQPWLLERTVDVPAANPWQLMDYVGYAYQKAAQEYKHDERKMALGLPRQIHGPLKKALPHQKTSKHPWKPPEKLRPHGLDRHASPVVVHVDKTSGGFRVRVLAFPSPRLPNLQKSRAFLKEFIELFANNLKDFRPPGSQGVRPRSGSTPGGSRGGGHRTPTTPVPQRRSNRTNPNLPSPGQIVDATLLEEKTKKGGWRARHTASGVSGPIVNTNETPSDWQPGMEVELKVEAANDQIINFRYQPKE